MAELYIKDVPGFSETADTITIQKSALAYTGYVPRSQMTTEETVLALIQEFGTIFTEAAQTADPDRQIVITLPTQDDIYLTGTAPNRYAVFPYAIQARQPAPTFTLIPTNY
jgi:hypothetical protein